MAVRVTRDGQECTSGLTPWRANCQYPRTSVASVVPMRNDTLPPGMCPTGHMSKDTCTRTFTAASLQNGDQEESASQVNVMNWEWFHVV